jgi:hypothetical protein
MPVFSVQSPIALSLMQLPQHNVQVVSGFSVIRVESQDIAQRLFGHGPILAILQIGIADAQEAAAQAA